MSETLEDFVSTVGDVVVAPSLGHAELLLALVVAVAFVASAILSLLPDDEDDKPWRERRS